MSRREGRVFRRCRTCGHRITTPAKICDHEHGGAVCGGEVGWGFVTDVALPGAKQRKRRTRSGFTTKKEAVAAMRDVQDAQSKGRLVEPTRRTVGEFLEEWLAAARNRVGHGLNDTGWRDYEVHVRCHIAPGIGELPLQALNANHVRGFYAWVQDGNSSRDGRRPAPKTVHNIHLTLHRALEDAIEDGLIPRNPASRARRPPKAGPEMLTWDEEQLRTFLGETADDRLYPLWRLTAMTGMRRGEVLGLRWDDLDSKAATIAIKRQRKRGEAGFVLAPPKTDRGRRTIDIDTETVTILKLWRRQQLEERVAYDDDWHETGFIFTRTDGRPHDVDAVSQSFNRVIRRAELPRIRFHDLRHTHATLLLSAGVPPHVVSMRLGHKSVAFTLQQYAHVLPQQQADAVELLATRLLGDT